MNLPRDQLLKGAEFRETLARLIDLAERALKNWEWVYSDFLSPPELEEALGVFETLADLQVIPWGGYAQAERQRLAFGHPSLEAAPIPVIALEISGNFLFDPATHRDFLGAVLGIGIIREKTGDVVVLKDRGAQMLVIPEIVATITLLVQKIRTVPVVVEAIPLERLEIRPPQVKDLVTTEASLRVDAVASAGFGMSRSKLVDLVSKGDVRINWRTITQPSKTVKTGDRVMVRGRGRLEIGEIQITKKDRYRIQLKRLT